MELWCKSKQWISTVVLLTSASARSANVSPDKSGRADVRISRRHRKRFYSMTCTSSFFLVLEDKNPLPFSHHARVISLCLVPSLP